jgi:branched-chain amino acid transport system ATP-binding protein
MKEMLSLQNVEVRYGAIQAVRSIALSVKEGEIVTLLGPNGAGKSSTLLAIMGLVPPSGGEIHFEGQLIAGEATEDIVRRGMTLVPEGRRVFPSLTVGENLRLGASIRKDRVGIAATLDGIFEMFPILGARKDQKAGSLSGGEQQQLSIGRALMSSPRMLLLDEPSLGLAPIIVDTLFDLIASLRSKGLTILLVEQNAERSLEIADRAYVFTNGKIKLSGTAAELLVTDDMKRAYMGIES